VGLGILVAPEDQIANVDLRRLLEFKQRRPRPLRIPPDVDSPCERHSHVLLVTLFHGGIAKAGLGRRGWKNTVQRPLSEVEIS
jgi:hypothetical protein